MASLNKVQLIGYLGADVETRYLPDGTAVANVSIATSEAWKDKSSGEKKERTEWTRLSFFGKVAEIASEYCHKGSQIYVEGKLQARKWQTDKGEDRYTTEVRVDRLLLLGSKKDDEKAPERERATTSKPAQPSSSAGKRNGGFDEMADDIPF